MSGSGRVQTGVIIGTAAALPIKMDFQPRAVKIINATHPGELQWTKDMPAAGGFKAITNGTNSQITTGGVTLGYTVTEKITEDAAATSTYTDNRGVTLGTDTDINQSGDTLYWSAVD